MSCSLELRRGVNRSEKRLALKAGRIKIKFIVKLRWILICHRLNIDLQRIWFF